MNVLKGLRWMFAAGATGLISGCASMHPEDFSKSSTRFELDRYLVGHLRSWGVFENNGGKPQRSFVCDSYGKRETNGVVILHQDFKFSDGKTQTRNWRIHRVDSTHWEATANDMVGVAEGKGIGNAFYWEYTITLDRKNPLAGLHVRQWMYQAENTDVLMTRLVITKWGEPIFQVSEVIHHVDDAKWKRDGSQ